MNNIVYGGKIYEKLSVDVSQANAFAPPLVKEGDSGTRGLIITVTDNGEPIEIPDSATAWLNCSNTADKEKHASVEGVINEDGTVTVDVPTVVMDVPGIIECDISIITLSESDQTEILKSTLFCLSCEKAANKSGTSTEAEDSILAGIAAGEITIPAAKGDPGPQGPVGPVGPQGPQGPAGSGVRVVTPEESQGWTDSIPTSFAGELYDIAGWNKYLWQLVNIDNGLYYWDKLLTEEDLVSALNNYYTRTQVNSLISTKMDLAPINPTAEQIAALPVGQLYGDTVNHKGNIKGGQEFYDTEYIDLELSNRPKKTILGTGSPIPVYIKLGNTMPKKGDIFIVDDRAFIVADLQGVFRLDAMEITYNPIGISSRNQRQFPESGTRRFIENRINVPFVDGEIIRVNDVLYKVSLTFDTESLAPDQVSYTYAFEKYVTDGYTKTEINTMIGDIETLLSEV